MGRPRNLLADQTRCGHVPISGSSSAGIRQSRTKGRHDAGTHGTKEHCSPHHMIWRRFVTLFCAFTVVMLVQDARDIRALPEGLLHAFLCSEWTCGVFHTWLTFNPTSSQHCRA